MRVETRPGRLGVVAMVATSALLTAAPASASHSYPATYSGSVAGGGSVEFDVSADGSAITRFKVTAVPTECGLLFSTFAGTPGVPIVDHAFSNTSSPLMFSGSFPAIQTAHGTVQERRSFPPCTSSPRGWNATTSAPAPDTTAPVIALSGRTTQRADGTVAVSVTSNEIGSGTATGTVIVRRTRRTAASFALGSAVTQLAPNVRARLKLRVPRRARTAIRKALRNGRRVSAVVTVSVRDAAGNSASRNRTVRLRRR